MKQMSRDPSARSKALRAERRADEKSGLGIITIKPLSSATNTLEGGPPGFGPGSGSGSTTTGGAGKGKGFKKGGFRNAFGGEVEAPAAVVGAAPAPALVKGKDDGWMQGEIEGREEEKGGVEAGVAGYDDEDDEEESENEKGDYAAEGGRYDPSRPTGCGEGCRGREVKEGGEEL